MTSGNYSDILRRNTYAPALLLSDQKIYTSNCLHLIFVLPLRGDSSMSKPAMRVAVTGAAGQIGYALLFRIASGE
ncbi:MAG: hypothetical protein KA735_13615, partial [Burkholderiaceae bacterium]|nr:hypothetical protein [Burkholderiaceae bacterium]